MSKVMLVNVTHVEESRVATLEDGVLAGYEIETINRTNIKGNIYNAVVESVHPNLEAAFVKLAPDLKGFLPLDEVNFKLLPSRSDSRKSGRIGQHLHPGQKLMAQVVREPFAGKPPTVSTYFSLPGRFLVLMPGVESSGVSRKIEDGTQRERLKKLIDELRPPEGFGLIVRTAGMGQTKTELQRDMKYLLRLWESVQRSSKDGEFPGLVYREADLVIRTIRDFMTPDVSEVWIDSQETYEIALRFVHDVMPSRAKTVRLYTGDRPLFNKFNLEEQIERIYKRRVPLPSGGEIVIDGTEALTAVDVNSARSKRSGDIDENNTLTNLEAAAEIARQLRLRDLGGLIVIDFIDLTASRNRAKVERAMRESMKGDRARHDMTRLSKLGLMEIARQRIKGAKMAASYATCAACDGYGLVKNVETAALAALRKLQARGVRGDVGRIRVKLPDDVAIWLANHKREEMLRIERRHGIQVEIVPALGLLRHESEFEAIARPPQEATTEEAKAATAKRPSDEGKTDESRRSEDQRKSEDKRQAGRARTDDKRRRPPRRKPADVEPERKDAVETPASPTSPETTRAAEVDPVTAEDEAAKTERADGETPGAGEKAVGEDRSPEEQKSAETKSTGNPEQEDSDASNREAEAKSRRRRRRKRRPRASQGARTDTPEAEPKPAKTEDEPPVPRGIKVDELMPAASGSAVGQKGNSRSGNSSSRPRSTNGRKKRGTAGSGRA
jgi:ribonuclease E